MTAIMYSIIVNLNFQIFCKSVSFTENNVNGCGFFFSFLFLLKTGNYNVIQPNIYSGTSKSPTKNLELV